MVERKTWEEFRDCKMLWWINMVLHTFGWAIAVDIEEGKIVSAYPARVKYRGFDEQNNTNGYIGVSEYLKDNAEELFNEAKA